MALNRFDDDWFDGDGEDKPISRMTSMSRRSPDPASDHPLLAPLASAQEALTRLNTLVSVASPAVSAGLRKRLAFKEASGWLAYTHIWLHPLDLALLSSSMTGSLSIAAMSGALNQSIPNTLAAGGRVSDIPDDRYIDLALRLATYHRRLSESPTWLRLSKTSEIIEAVEHINPSCGVHVDDLDDWLIDARSVNAASPALLHAAAACRWWLNLPGSTADLSPDGLFLAALAWREKAGRQQVALPFWSSPAPEIHRLASKTGVKWTAGFLECICTAATATLQELAKLQAVESKIKDIRTTARSKLQEAATCALASPVVTAKTISRDLKISNQAAHQLIAHLTSAGILGEKTNRQSWRAYSVA